MIIKTRRQLFDEGWSTSDIARSVRRGELDRVATGRYVVVTPGPPVRASDRHVALAKATMLSDDQHFTDETAALLLGLPVLKVPRLLQVGCPGDGSSWRRQDRIVRSTSMPHAPVVTVDGVRVSSPTRTVLDIACRRGIEAGAVVGDQALRARLTTSSELTVLLPRYAGRVGVARARAVVPILDAASESVGETRSRLAIRAMSIPQPVTQFEVRGEGGIVIARLDFAWPEQRVGGDFDGMIKYRGTFGKNAADVIRDQQRRDAALQRAGWTPVHWLWEDLDRPGDLELRLKRALKQVAA